MEQAAGRGSRLIEQADRAGRLQSTTQGGVTKRRVRNLDVPAGLLASFGVAVKLRWMEGVVVVGPG